MVGRCGNVAGKAFDGSAVFFFQDAQTVEQFDHNFRTDVFSILCLGRGGDEDKPASHDAFDEGTCSRDQLFKHLFAAVVAPEVAG